MNNRIKTKLIIRTVQIYFKNIADDLYAATKYDNDLAWIIMSAQNTGHIP